MLDLSYLLLKTIVVYIWRFLLEALGPHKNWVVPLFAALMFLVLLGHPHEDQMDRDFMAAKSQKCTFWTQTYPMRQFTIYAVGEGENQYLRMDQFVSGATGRQAEYVLVSSGTTYVWNTWSKTAQTGVKFPNVPVPFMEYFGVESIRHKDLTCVSWTPEKGKFLVPGNISFRAVSPDEFERDEMYTPALKIYRRNGRVR